MILNPAIIAMLIGSVLVTAFSLYAASIGIQIIRWWDIRSGSERQLMLEKKTYLVSTIFSYFLGFEFLSLFLFVHTADQIHLLFVGAMCAAGSLNVNEFGYPTLIAKLLSFILCGIWLLLNHADNKGEDYPFIRSKYKLMLWVTGALAFETLVQTNYFLRLKADVITSCCGTLFSEETETISGELAALPPLGTLILLLVSLLLTVRAGIHFLVTGRAARVFSGFAACALILSFASVISFISLYFYELPTHHCPFCLLQSEYHYVGYPLYLSLLVAGTTGVGVGVIDRLQGRSDHRDRIRRFEKKLCLVSMASYIIFIMISIYPMIFSDFILEGI
ncbi:MAG: hypothetical protein ACOWYE_08725 [Desulfatiglandales bacterium]